MTHSFRISIRCSALYLEQYRVDRPEMLAKGDGSRTANIVGDVYIHPSAKVHPTAKVSEPGCFAVVCWDLALLRPIFSDVPAIT